MSQMITLYRGVPHNWKEWQRPENDIDVQWTIYKSDAVMYAGVTDVDIEAGMVGYVLTASVPKSWIVRGEQEWWYQLSHAPRINRLRTPNIPPSIFSENNGYFATPALDFWIEHDLNKESPGLQLDYKTLKWYAVPTVKDIRDEIEAKIQRPQTI